MTERPQVRGACLDDKSFIPATLQCSRRCPVRSDYLELCFETDEGPWTWCFRDCEDMGAPEYGSGLLALTVGPYGAQARRVEDGRLGFVLQVTTALSMILGGSRVTVARRLVERGW